MVGYWICDTCGVTTDVTLYCQKLRKSGFLIAPILPTCGECGSEVQRVTREPGEHACRVFLLSGPIGSGKTTLAEHLFRELGFHAIDHDCLIDLAAYKHNRKVEFNGPEVLEALEGNLDLLLGLGKDIVLSLVILPAELDTYRAMLLSRGLNYRIFFLCPDYRTVLDRTKTRKCFGSVTPEKWVQHFYEETEPFRRLQHDDVVLVDNREMTIEETVETVLSSFQ